MNYKRSFRNFYAQIDKFCMVYRDFIVKILAQIKMWKYARNPALRLIYAVNVGLMNVLELLTSTRPYRIHFYLFDRPFSIFIM